ncbi:hypothetical protein Fmac_018799 [Flemingia macrophylla]|uniref:Uncharacterized protein n=1 Tax=Flemingia macrophylla TaxID=520843 RepID=A0ABD1M6N6_9FABA
MSSSEGVFELGIDELSEANNVLLMSLLEETQEEEYYGDDRLVSMIQSLEAEISDTEMMGHVDDHDCSTSDSGPDDHWIDMEMISSLPFDEMNNAYIPCGDEMMMEHAPMPYELGNDIDDFQWFVCADFSLCCVVSSVGMQ